MTYTKTFALRDPDHNVTLSGYYSRTWDVMAGAGDDEDYHVEIVARFASEKDARRYVDNDNDTHYVIGVRPPNGYVEAALAWVNVVTSHHLEGVRGP